MGRRATGANAIAKLAFEDVYGVPQDAGYWKIPFVTSQLGEEQGLVASDLLGQGREPLDPTLDVANDTGDVVVPVDARYFGLWLKLYMGAPTETAVAAAGGAFAFSANPVATGTITIDGVAWTFVAGDAAGMQTNIGANLAATLAQLATDLNASANATLAQNTYAVDGTSLTVTKDAQGAGGNATTLAANANSKATPSGATLTGGATMHTFTSGATELPSADVEIGHPDLATPVYGMNFGGRGNTLKVELARSGMLNATANLICQGETLNGDTADDAALEWLITRFSQFQGEVKKDGSVLADVVKADWTYSNDLDTVEVIRNDGRIEDADPGTVAMTGTITTRFADTVLLDLATSGEPVEISFGHSISASLSILVTVHRVFLPKAKRPITGPKGIQIDFAYQASKDPTLGHTVTVDLVNDIATYN